LLLFFLDTPQVIFCAKNKRLLSESHLQNQIQVYNIDFINWVHKGAYLSKNV